MSQVQVLSGAWGIVQLVERAAVNRYVVGSSPTTPVGEVVEWLKALVLKTSEVKASVGSNPTLSVVPFV